jgi:hypothetical protein
LAKTCTGFSGRATTSAGGVVCPVVVLMAAGCTELVQSGRVENQQTGNNAWI